jgi:hypothetical protein
VRGLSFAYRQFWSKMSKRKRNEGVWGGIYTPHPETSRWERVPGNSGYMSEYSGRWCPETPDQSVLRTGNSNPKTPGIRPGTPDTLSGHSGLGPGHSGLDREYYRKCPF